MKGLSLDLGCRFLFPRSARVAAWFCAAVFVLCSAAPLAAEEGWSWSKLNPFSGWGSSTSGSSGSAARNTTTSNSSWWKPKLWNPFSSLRPSLPAAGQAQGPSMWTRMSNSVASGSRTAWNYTSTALQPWKWGQSSNQPLTGTRRAQSWHNNDKTASRSSWNPMNWFATKKEPEEPRTVSDFMRMPRAKF